MKSGLGEAEGVDEFWKSVEIEKNISVRDFSLKAINEVGLVCSGQASAKEE
jgi:hypothetical protein